MRRAELWLSDLKYLARKKGWRYVALMFLVGPFVIAWHLIGMGLEITGEWMIRVGGGR